MNLDTSKAIKSVSYNGAELQIAGRNILTVNAPTGSTVTATKDSEVKTAVENNGVWTFKGLEAGTWTITASLGSYSQTYTREFVDEMTVDVTYVSSTLNDNSWSVIGEISDAGQAENWWSVGDIKNETLSGTWGILNVSGLTVGAYIIGFNHNSGKEGTNRIHFKFGKIDGVQAAFCDSSYNSSGSGIMFHMNSSNSNSGGWKNSYMRVTLLGNNNGPSSPLSGSLMACVSAELRAALKATTKYSDNTGGGSNTASYVTATTDYFWLLAEFEIFGTRSSANSYEQYEQAQYQYYKAGNAKIHYRHDARTTAVHVWLRSVNASSSSSFCYVNTSGTAYNLHAGYSLGCAPAFAA